MLVCLQVTVYQPPLACGRHDIKGHGGCAHFHLRSGRQKMHSGLLGWAVREIAWTSPCPKEASGPVGVGGASQGGTQHRRTAG